MLKHVKTRKPGSLVVSLQQNHRGHVVLRSDFFRHPVSSSQASWSSNLACNLGDQKHYTGTNTTRSSPWPLVCFVTSLSDLLGLINEYGLRYTDILIYLPIDAIIIIMCQSQWWSTDLSTVYLNLETTYSLLSLDSLLKWQLFQDATGRKPFLRRTMWPCWCFSKFWYARTIRFECFDHENDQQPRW